MVDGSEGIARESRTDGALRSPHVARHPPLPRDPHRDAIGVRPHGRAPARVVEPPGHGAGAPVGPRPRRRRPGRRARSGADHRPHRAGRRLDSVADLAAVHDWIAGTDDLDPDRCALYGGSYGGYMVLSGLVHQSERWAAGVDIVGIVNLVTFLEHRSVAACVART
ncbi:MAG TPA: prolyl oligopeptidase family serine peptidase [Euzebyales bacterium]